VYQINAFLPEITHRLDDMIKGYPDKRDEDFRALFTRLIELKDDERKQYDTVSKLYYNRIVHWPTKKHTKERIISDWDAIRVESFNKYLNEVRSLNDNWQTTVLDYHILIRDRNYRMRNWSRSKSKKMRDRNTSSSKLHNRRKEVYLANLNELEKQHNNNMENIDSNEKQELKRQADRDDKLISSLRSSIKSSNAKYTLFKDTTINNDLDTHAYGTYAPGMKNAQSDCKRMCDGMKQCRGFVYWDNKHNPDNPSCIIKKKINRKDMVGMSGWHVYQKT
jgi:hypothetical protein